MTVRIKIAACRGLKPIARFWWEPTTKCSSSGDAPGFKLFLSIGDRVEQTHIQALVSKTRIEALDEAVLSWLARPDVIDPNLMRVRPSIKSRGAELRPVVAGDRLWLPGSSGRLV